MTLCSNLRVNVSLLAVLATAASCSSSSGGASGTPQGQAPAGAIPQAGMITLPEPSETPTTGTPESVELPNPGSVAAPVPGPVESPVILAPLVEEPEVTVAPAQQVCNAITSEPSVVTDPVDIVMVIDTSRSMGEEIEAVQANINEHFAAILEADNIDFRVVLVSRSSARTSSLGVCIEEPLGPAPCQGRDAADSPNAPDRFFHVDATIGSKDAWCVLPEIAEPSDPGNSQDPLAAERPTDGWVGFLREGTQKVFLMFSDDASGAFFDDQQELDCSFSGVPCSTVNGVPVCELPNIVPAEEYALMFDEQLMTLAPEHFGGPGDRNYVWHSIVGVAEKSDPSLPYEADEPIVGEACETAANNGDSHQALSRLTGGIRFPVCHTESYNSVFNHVARSVIRQVSLPCAWGIPEVTDGEAFDPGRVNLDFVSESAAETGFVGVASLSECGDVNGWYYDDPSSPTEIRACPAACEFLSTQTGGRVELEFGCQTRHAPVVR